MSAVARIAGTIAPVRFLSPSTVRWNSVSATWVGAVALFVILACAYIASVDIRATQGASITGDEPFYLLTTQSLLQDGDLDLNQQYQKRSYESFFDHPDSLWMQSVPRDDGTLLSPHNLGLSILVLPGFAIGGLVGAQVQLLVMAAVTFALTYVLVVRITRAPLLSWLATLAVALSATAFIYSTEIYPELPAALALVVALLIVQNTRRPGVGRALALTASLTVLMWLGVKYAPLACLVAAWALWGMDRSQRTAFLTAATVSAGLFAWFHLKTFGALTPYSVGVVYAGDGTLALLGEHLGFARRVYRLLGLFVDERFGIARWAPVLLLVIPALPLLWKARGLSHLVALLIAVQLFIATFVAITMMGWWFPGRTLLTVLPLMALPLVILLLRTPNIVRAAIGALAIYSLAITVALAMAGHAREIVIAVDPFEMTSPVFQFIAPIVPDYRSWGAGNWGLTAGWLLVIGAATAVAYLASRRPNVGLNSGV